LSLIFEENDSKFVTIPLSIFNGFAPINLEMVEDSAEKRGLIISIIDRFTFARRIDKANNPLEFEYMKEVAFTKGQTIIFAKDKFLCFKNFINTRKIYLKSPLKIEEIEEIELSDFFFNKNYSQKIFISDLEYQGFDFSKLSPKKIKVKKLLENLNHLNSTNFSINKELMAKIENYKNNNITYFKDTFDKDKNIENFKIDNPELYDEEKINTFDVNIQKLFSNKAIFNLIKIQMERIINYNNKMSIKENKTQDIKNI
jgi:hypothetical protein